MKRSIFIAAAAAAALAVPASAGADANNGTDCSYAQTEEVSTGGAAPVVLYAGTGGDAGMSGTALVAAGGCVNGLALAGFDGGAAEAGAGTPAGGPGGYAIVDGDNGNATPDGQSDGYIGVSNYETGGKGSCNGGGGGTNSGGCFGVDGGPATVPLPIACGNTSSPSWNNTPRDGCSIP